MTILTWQLADNACCHYWYLPLLFKSFMPIMFPITNHLARLRTFTEWYSMRAFLDLLTFREQFYRSRTIDLRGLGRGKMRLLSTSGQWKRRLSADLLHPWNPRGSQTAPPVKAPEP
jgi:hypothetical protein